MRTYKFKLGKIVAFVILSFPLMLHQDGHITWVGLDEVMADTLPTTLSAIPTDQPFTTFGNGFNSITNTPLPNKCVTYDGGANEITTFMGDGKGSTQETAVDALEVNTAEDLFRALDFRSSASFKYGVFSADAGLDYFESGKLSRYKNFFVFKVIVKNLTEFIKTPHLTQQARAWAKDRLTFLNKCGDRFISGRISGGEYITSIEIESSRTEEQKNTAAFLRAAVSGLKGSGEINASIKDTFTSMVQSGRVHSTVLRKGPAEDLPQLTLESLRDYGLRLPNKVNPNGGTPWPIAVLTSAYDGLVDYQESPEQAETLSALFDVYKKAITRKANLQYISSKKSEFGPYPVDVLDQELDKIEDLAKVLRGKASTCARDKAKCAKVPAYKIPETPDRIEWISIDPQQSAPRSITVVPSGAQRWVWIRGYWSPYSSGDSWFPPGQSTSLWFQNLATPTSPPDQMWSPDVLITAPIKVPGNHEVFFKVHDQSYVDNRPHPTDPIRAGVFEDLVLMK